MYGVEKGDQGPAKTGQNVNIRTENNLRQLRQFHQRGMIQALGNHDFPRGGFLPPENPIMEQYYQEFERVLGEEDIHQYWAGNYFVEKENLRVIVLNTNYLVSTDNNYANEDDTTGDKIMRWLSTVSAGTKPCLLVGHHSPLWYGAIKLQYRALQNTKCVAAWGHGHFTASRANHEWRQVRHRGMIATFPRLWLQILVMVLTYASWNEYLLVWTKTVMFKETSGKSRRSTSKTRSPVFSLRKDVRVSSTGATLRLTLKQM